MSALVIGNVGCMGDILDALMACGFSEIRCSGCKNIRCKDLKPDMVVIVKHGIEEKELPVICKKAGVFNAPVVLW